jgi:hypothetical protein
MLNPKPTGLGGGGAMFQPRISPFNSDLAFVACDMLAIYRTANGGVTWAMCDTREVHGSPSFSVAFDPADGGRVIGYHSERGLRESTDEGQTWGPYSGTLPKVIEKTLKLTAAAFSSSGELFIGTKKGLYRLINNGWAQVLPAADLVDETRTYPGDSVTVNAGEVLKVTFVRSPGGDELCWVATVRHIYVCNLANGGNTWTTVEQGLPLQPTTGPPVSMFAGDSDQPNWEYVASPVRDLAASYVPNLYYVVYATISGAPTSRWDARTVTGFSFTGGVYSYYVDFSALIFPPQWKPAMGSGGQTLDQTIFNPWIYQSQNPPKDPLDFFLGTPIARYERLATTEQVQSGTNLDPDTVYVSVIKQAGAVDIYRSLDRGQHWDPAYSGEQQPGNHSLDPGWIDVPKLSSVQPAGTYGGLGWGFGGAAKGLTCAPANHNVVLLSNNGVVHKTDNGAEPTSSLIRWAQVYTDKVPARPGATSPTWRTRGLEVTSTWRYVVHPDDETVAFICATDIGLARSEDGGDSWTSVSQATQTPTATELDIWHNCYDLAFGDAPGNAPRAIWAAVSTQHDLPHHKDLKNTGHGGVVQSNDKGKTWYRIGNTTGLPDHPVVSLARINRRLDQPGFPAAPPHLLASVWGDGIYFSAITVAGGVETPGTWTPLTTQVQGGGTVTTTHSYRIQFDSATQTLYWLVSGHTAASGLYSLYLPQIYSGGGFLRPPYVPSRVQWKPLTAGLTAQLGPGQLYPVDFAVRNVPGGRHLYLCTSAFGGGPAGKVWKYDGNTWIDLGAPLHGSYFNQDNWFAPFFVGGRCYITATSHGLWSAPAADVDQASVPVSLTWTEENALNYIRVQRLNQHPDGRLYISTFGGGMWYV